MRLSGLFGFLLLIPAVFLTGAGVKAWIAMAQYKEPITVTYAEFAKKMPNSGWYTVTGAMVDVSRAVYWEQNGVCVDVFAPLIPLNGQYTPLSRFPDIYVEVDDSRTLTAMIDSKYAHRSRGEQGEREYVNQHRDVFWQRRDVSGLVSLGRRDPMGEWSRLGINAATVTFIADGWKPNALLAYGGTLSGLALSLLCIGMLIKSFLDSRR